MDFMKHFEQFNLDQFKLDQFNLDQFNLDQFTTVSKDAMDAIMRVNEAATGRMEQLFRLNSEIVNETLENSMDHMKGLTDLKKPEDVVTNNLNFLSDISKKAIENSQKYVDFCVDCQSELTGLIQDGMVSAASVSTAANRKAA